MNITLEQLDKLNRIYNTLLVIETRGENTLIMADCVRALKQTIQEIQISNTPPAPLASSAD